MDYFDAVFYKWDSGAEGSLFYIAHDGSNYLLEAWQAGTTTTYTQATLSGKPSGIAALRDRGIVITIEGANGYHIYSADKASPNTKLDCFRNSGTTTCENTT